MLDAVVVGAGPNGLTAAVELARRGCAVEIFEAADTIGGGSRTEELTLPGFRHDPCSAVHPLAIGSPAFERMPLSRYGLEWLHPELPLAHPFPDGTAAVLARSVGETAMSLGPRDAGTYRRLLAPYLGRWATLAPDLLRAHWDGVPPRPDHLGPLRAARAPAGLAARRSAPLPRREGARPVRRAGRARHRATSAPTTGGPALMFAVAAHEVGWPIPRGGSQSIVDALGAYLRAHGGTIHVSTEVKRLDELPPARAYIFDTSPRALARIAGLGNAYRRYRYGASAFKIDYALSGPGPLDRAPTPAARAPSTSAPPLARSARRCGPPSRAATPPSRS
ncbi:phytoene desaturase family protein [Streptomyces iranensis]|uniref:phytoene desaturase family protein n=1 Tax=Streptomyces iranensis TaxID=576784 RepID=UPI0039B75EC9